MQVAVSMTRAASLIRRSPMVANSAVRSAAVARHRVAQLPHEPVGGSMQDQAHLIGVGAAAKKHRSP